MFGAKPKHCRMPSSTVYCAKKSVHAGEVHVHVHGRHPLPHEDHSPVNRGAGIGTKTMTTLCYLESSANKTKMGMRHEPSRHYLQSNLCCPFLGSRHCTYLPPPDPACQPGIAQPQY